MVARFKVETHSFTTDEVRRALRAYLIATGKSISAGRIQLVLLTLAPDNETAAMLDVQVPEYPPGDLIHTQGELGQAEATAGHG